MKLKTYLKDGNRLFSDNMTDNISILYGIDELPTWLENDMLSVYERYIRVNKSNNEIYADSEELNIIIETIQERTELLFISNFLKYQHLHDLFVADYNPLWNVDGTETTTRKLTDDRATTGTGNETITYNTENNINREDTTTHGKTDTTSYNVNDTEENKTSKTTFDSNNFYDTDRNDINKGKTGTEEIKTSGEDKEKVTETGKKTGTDGKQSTNTGTDKQTINETISHTRGGNIGVTTTQTMAEQELEYANKINFIKIVCNDIVHEICLYC